MPCVHLRQLYFPDCYKSLLELVTERRVCDQNFIYKGVKNNIQACSWLLLEDIIETVAIRL